MSFKDTLTGGGIVALLAAGIIGFFGGDVANPNVVPTSGDGFSAAAFCRDATLSSIQDDHIGGVRRTAVKGLERIEWPDTGDNVAAVYYYYENGEQVSRDVAIEGEAQNCMRAQ